LPTGCKVLDVHFTEVSRDGCAAFVELESEENVKLAISRCMNATHDMYGRVFGMCSSSVSKTRYDVRPSPILGKCHF